MNIRLRQVFTAIVMMMLCLGLSGGLPAMAQGAAYTPGAVAAEKPLLLIRGIGVDPATGVLSIQGHQPFSLNNAKNYSLLKLPNPNRVVIEIPDARLGISEGVLPIRQNGVKEVEVSQKQSQFYNAVRIIVHVDDTQTLWKLNAANQDTTLLIGPMGAPVMAQALSPGDVADRKKEIALPAGVNVVEDIYYRDNILSLRGRGISKLEVKNRFKLSDPERLVIDLANTSAASKDLLKPFRGTDPLIREIRVGQFDEKTLRIVVETPRPEQFQIVYPASDKSMLTVGPYLDTAVSQLPSDVQLGQVKNVFLTRENGRSVLRIVSSSPMVHRVKKEDQKLYVDLLNTAATPGWIHYDESAHPLIQYLKLEPLTAGQPNAKLVVDLTSDKVLMDSELSADGRTLEISLADGALGAMGLSASGSKAPYPARIVIDAGHGGKDMGANRSGVNEKDLNLSLALMVKRELEERGFKVYMTRDTDIFLPLPKITQITNSINPDLFVSIHHNASTNPGLNGIETYYYTAHSKPLADRIHRQLASRVSAPDRGVRQAMFYVIHHTPVPAVLCEIGYVSNPAELRDLQTWERKSKSANAIADGVVDYLKSKMSAKAR